MTRATIYDTTPCELGEGPLWHPERGQLFWFDILGRRLHTRTAAGPEAHAFPEIVSAAGWIDRERLLIASQSALFVHHLDTGARETLTPLDADNAATRANDGRADPWGGFWIGTMGKRAEPGAGAIWRWYRGELRRLYTLTIPNAISFCPDRSAAHFADTPTGRVMRVALDENGWPAGEPSVFLNLAPEGLNPDGAVIDAEGLLWLAEWGAGRVSAYGADGRRRHSVETPGAPNTSCPAFGGPDFATLYITTAREHLTPEALAAAPASGSTFAAPAPTRGLPEWRVLL